MTKLLDFHNEIFTFYASLSINKLSLFNLVAIRLAKCIKIIFSVFILTS